MKEICLDKIVSITLELLERKTVCLPPAEILRLIGVNVHFFVEKHRKQTHYFQLFSKRMEI